MSEIMTTQEISKQLRVSDRTVRNWIESGLLKAYKFGSQYRVMKEDYETFINQSQLKNED